MRQIALPEGHKETDTLHARHIFCQRLNLLVVKKDRKEKTIYIYNVCDHQECYREVGSQAISYTTGVPAMIGAALVVDKVWDKDGVFNVEEFDPDPFMDMLNEYGLPWVVDENPKTVE